MCRTDNNKLLELEEKLLKILIYLDYTTLNLLTLATKIFCIYKRRPCNNGQSFLSVYRQRSSHTGHTLCVMETVQEEIYKQITKIRQRRGSDNHSGHQRDHQSGINGGPSATCAPASTTAAALADVTTICI